MDYDKFISAKEVEIGGRKFAISKIPSIEAVESVYPAVAKSVQMHGILGVTMLDFNIIRTMLKYTALRLDSGAWHPLDIDTRISDTFDGKFKDLQMLVVAMVKENFDFLTDGNLREVLGLQEADQGSDS